jgi:hypothetical protein
MNTVLSVFAASLLVEFITIFARLVWHLRSKQMQKSMHVPRIHHAYIGIVLLATYLLFAQSLLIFIIALALIFSDIIHHLVIIPVLKSSRVDIKMSHHKKIHHYLRQMAIYVILLLIILSMLPFGIW